MVGRRLLCLLMLVVVTGCFSFFSDEKPRLDLGSIPFGVERVEKVFFDSGKYKIGNSGRRILLGLAKQMQHNSRMSLLVVGHTDANGSDECNLTLGKQRAEAVKEFIVSHDSSLASRISTQSRGKSEPEILVYSSDSKEIEKAYAHNRRAVIVVGFSGQERRSSGSDIDSSVFVEERNRDSLKDGTIEGVLDGAEDETIEEGMSSDVLDSTSETEPAIQ